MMYVKLILQPFRWFTYVIAHSPTLLLLLLRHRLFTYEQSSFSNLSVSSPTSQLILQPFCRFSYITDHSPTIPLLHQRHSSFSNPSFASPTSQSLHLHHLTSHHCYEYSSIFLCAHTRKLFTSLPIPAVSFKETTNSLSPPLLPSNIFAGRFS